MRLTVRGIIDKHIKESSATGLINYDAGCNCTTPCVALRLGCKERRVKLLQEVFRDEGVCNA